MSCSGDQSGFKCEMSGVLNNWKTQILSTVSYFLTILIFVIRILGHQDSFTVSSYNRFLKQLFFDYNSESSSSIFGSLKNEEINLRVSLVRGITDCFQESPYNQSLRATELSNNDVLLEYHGYQKQKKIEVSGRYFTLTDLMRFLHLFVSCKCLLKRFLSKTFSIFAEKKA